MKILLTGAGGQLGLELANLLPERGHETLALGREELNISDAAQVERAFAEGSPDLVINAAAYTDVDGAQKERELSYAANAVGPANLARTCERSGAELLHVSTNYVFDGEQERPYEPFDPARPLGVYGRDKLAGEELVRGLCNRWYVVRTAGVYGEGRNFVRTMLRVAKERNSLRVKDDEYVSPTLAKDLSGSILKIVEGRRYGVYHAASAGACSWHEFAVEIFRLAGVEVTVEPVPSSEYPLPAARPANGVLTDPGFPRLRHWREALLEYLASEVL